MSIEHIISIMYSPDLHEKAVHTVIDQAKLLAEDLTKD